jgi:hypothetical protein
MRPKKSVYLYCADYDRRNDLAFVLRIRCPWAMIEPFREIAELAEALEEDREFGCVVLVRADIGDRQSDGSRRDGDLSDISERVDFEWLLRMPGVAARAVEVIKAGCQPDRISFASHFVPAGDIASLAESMRVASSRKRGPKFQQPSEPKTAVA